MNLHVWLVSVWAFHGKIIQDHAVKNSSLFNVTMACNWLYIVGFGVCFCHTVVHLFNQKYPLRYFEMMKSKKRHDRQSVCCFDGLNHRSIFNQPGLDSWRFFRSYATHGGRCIKLGWCTCTSVTWWKPWTGLALKLLFFFFTFFDYRIPTRIYNFVVNLDSDYRTIT